jgi:hypothetical protein
MKPFTLREHEARAGERLRMVVRVIKIRSIMGTMVPITSPREEFIELAPGEFQEGQGNYLSTGDLSGPYPLPLKAGQSYWCRETYVIESDREYVGAVPLPDDGRPIKVIDCPEWGRHHMIPHYRATEPEPHIVPPDLPDTFDDRTRWSSSQTMPQWASRYTMTVQDVRVCRIDEITEDEARMVTCNVSMADMRRQACWTERQDFAQIWNATAKPGERWDENPWICAARVEVTAKE